MTISITVDVDPLDILDDIDENDVADYLRDMGYWVEEEPSAGENEMLTKENILFLQSKLNTSDWEERRIYDKLLNMRG
jgi:hypothetical protein